MANDAQRLMVAAVTVGLSGMVAVLLLRRRRSAGSPHLSQRRLLARYPSRVAGRQWYPLVVVTEEQSSACEAVRALHLGSEENIPESVVRLVRSSTTEPWRPVANVLMKPHLQHSLLAFAWLDGFPAGSRAALIGVAGGSLLHFWRECVPGGAGLRIDAVELDAAVLDAAREHLGLGMCEPPHGLTTFHVDDGASFLAAAEDEIYDLLVVDLDMGSLVPPSCEPSPVGASGAASGSAAGGTAPGRRRLEPLAPDPTRDMYRVLSERGVLVINEYSECAPAERLSRAVTLTRLLRRFFPEVHTLRTTTHHNTMFICPVERGAGCAALSDLIARAKQVSASLGLGGIALGDVLESIPANRHMVSA